ncbi:hypothetical protein SXCC_02135 [Gluconacetobacter sp. SXCC-1]|nr:hypothetical protein SXCC_02135 [Gluconacetobacter sp. SXCC-1]
MGQISMKISALPGSVLSENQHSAAMPLRNVSTETDVSSTSL